MAGRARRLPKASGQSRRPRPYLEHPAATSLQHLEVAGGCGYRHRVVLEVAHDQLEEPSPAVRAAEAGVAGSDVPVGVGGEAPASIAAEQPFELVSGARPALLPKERRGVEEARIVPPRARIV